MFFAPDEQVACGVVTSDMSVKCVGGWVNATLVSSTLMLQKCSPVTVYHSRMPYNNISESKN